MKGLFSERYGYVKPTDVLITGRMTPEITNSICTCYDILKDSLYKGGSSTFGYRELEAYLWVFFLRNRKDEFTGAWGNAETVATEYIQKNDVEWYRKFDMTEATVRYLFAVADSYIKQLIRKATEAFVGNLNYLFKDLNFGNNIVNMLIVPVTSDMEIKAIEEAVKDAENYVRMHLNSALERLAARPIGDYRYSIKDSISAVELIAATRPERALLGRLWQQWRIPA